MIYSCKPMVSLISRSLSTRLKARCAAFNVASAAADAAAAEAAVLPPGSLVSGVDFPLKQSIEDHFLERFWKDLMGIYNFYI